MPLNRWTGKEQRIAFPIKDCIMNPVTKSTLFPPAQNPPHSIMTLFTLPQGGLPFLTSLICISFKMILILWVQRVIMAQMTQIKGRRNLSLAWLKLKPQKEGNLICCSCTESHGRQRVSKALAVTKNRICLALSTWHSYLAQHIPLHTTTDRIAVSCLETLKGINGCTTWPCAEGTVKISELTDSPLQVYLITLYSIFSSL